MMRLKPAQTAVALVYMTGLVALSSLPGQQLANLGLSAFLQTLHVSLFAGLALVTLSAIQGPAPLRIGLGVMICLAFAVTDEWHQSFVPGRVASFEDVAADAAGIALGVLLWEGLRPIVLAFKGSSQQ